MSNLLQDLWLGLIDVPRSVFAKPDLLDIDYCSMIMESIPLHVCTGDKIIFI